jgi:parallel beta-helix repeat protein
VTAGGAGTLTVNGTADTNTRDSVLTLREAIMLSEGTLAKSALLLGEWNQVVGCPGNGIADTIGFTAALGTITVSGSVLPSVSDAAGTIITAVGSTVQLTQSGLPAGSNGLSFTSVTNKVLGMIIRNFPSSGISVTGNTNKLFHNTLHSNGTGVAIGAGVTGLDMRNNLMTNNTTSGVSAASTVGTMDFNGYFNNGAGGNVHCTGGCTIGANSIKADPRYTSSGTNDFSLLASSPAVDRGIDLAGDQPDMNGASAGLFNSTAPDMGALESTFSTPPVASSAISELVPITVYYTSTGIPFTWENLPTISSVQSGVDRFALTIPTGFISPAVTSVVVSGTTLTLGGANCSAAPNLPDTGEYCVTIAGSVLTVTSGLRVLDTTSNKRVTISLTLSSPGVIGNSIFTVTMRDAMTSASLVTATAGNVNGTAGNGITDNDTLTVETVDRVIVRNNNDATNGNMTSAWMLVPFPGTDGISLREAITATQVGGSANNNPVPEIIVFNTTTFPAVSQVPITPGSELPALTDPAGTTIDAFTAPYLAGVLLDGSGLSATTNGLLLSSNNNIVRNLVFQNYGFGVTISAGFSSNEVSKNLINNARTKGIMINSGSFHTIKENTVAASNGVGIDTAGSPTSLTIRDNIVSSSGGAGIEICCTTPTSNSVINNQVASNIGGGIVVSGGSGNTIDSNTVLNNTGGIKATSSTTITITKNLVGETIGIGILVGVGSSGAKITINTVRNATSDGIQVLANTPKIFHNTLNNNTGDGTEVGASVTGFDVRNNIFSNNTASGLNAPSGGTINYNDYFNNTGGGACIGGCVIGANSITTDPLYVNPASPTYDFHLREPNSPAINVGLDLGVDQQDVNGATAGLYNGTAPDMGAQESTVSGAPQALSLKVSTSTPSALSGGSAIYTITLTNTGGTVANGVVATATLPAGFTFLSGSTVVSGNATRSPSTPDPAGGESAPQWGTFSVPATTGTLTVTFHAGIACSVLAGTYQTSGSATSSNVTIPSYDGATGTLDDVTVVIGDPIIIVNSLGDGNVRDSVLTLREAILLANETLSTQALTAAERNQISGCVGAGIHETINFDGGIFPSATPGIITVSGSSLPSLTDAAGVLFDGFGKGVIIDGGNVGSLIGLTLASNTNFLRNFTVKRFAGTGANGVGILLSTASTNTLTGVTATQNGTTGIFVSGGSGNTLTSITTTSNGTLGIEVTGANTTMTTITATGNADGGIKVSTGNTNTITTSTISSNTGIGVLFGSNSNSLTGSTLDLNTTIGVFVSGTTNTVSTNTITNSGTNGLSIAGNTNTTIATNTITGSVQRGLLITGSANTATGNTIGSNGTGGVLIQTGTGNTVTGGTINSNTGAGVRIESNSNTVSSATVSSNTAGGAIVAGNSNTLTLLTMATNTGIGVELTGSSTTLSSSTITSPTSFGVRVMTGTANTISSNTIDGATSAGVRFESAGNLLSGGVVTNTITGPGVTVLGGDNNAIDSVSIRTNAGAGISLAAGIGAIIQYNRIATNTGAGIDIAAAATGGKIQVNTINGNTGNGITINGNTTLVYNNTVSHNSLSGVVIGGTVTGFDLRNNQFTFNTGGPGINAPAGGTIDYNNTYGNTPSGVCAGGCALGVNAIKADPRYASAGTLYTNSFALNSSSPAINRGLDLGASQPDLNGGLAGNFDSTAPDIGAVESSLSTPVVATSATAELIPITVYWQSSLIPFTWESLPVIGASNSGVDRVNLTLPTGYSIPAVTSVIVSGTTLALGTGNCAPALLPEPNEYCPQVSGQLFSVIFSNRVLDTAGNKRITINFTLTVPTVKDAGLVFVSNVDDQMTSSATVAATAGNVNGTAGNGITDNDTLTVTTVDTVQVRNTTDTVNGDVTSAWMLVPFPGTDGISLREAMTAVNAGVSVGFLDTIDFNAGVFPQATPATIAMTSALPTISDAAGTAISALNKTTTPVTLPAGVILDGATAGIGVAGLTMTTGSNRLLGLVIQNFLGAGVVMGTGSGNEVSGMLILGNAGGGITVAGNSDKIFQNTINNSAIGVTVLAGVTGLDLRNNLITNNTTAGISAASGVGTIDFSGYFNNGSSGNVHCTGGCLIGANAIKTDPRYTSAVNFALLASSPAINRGVDLVGNQPDMNGATAGNFNQGVPDLGARETTFAIPAVATSAISELIPITVYFGSSGIPFTWDVQPTISSSQSGVDQVLLTLPALYITPAVTGVTVSGVALTAGTTNCTTAPNLPDNNEYCASATSSVLTVAVGKRVLDTTATKQITVNFTLTVPGAADAGKTFSGVVDDAMTSSATVSAPAGNANGVAANGITDNNTLTVTTVDKVTVRNTTDLVNGDVTSAWMLVPFPGTDGISLREAMTAVNAGSSVGFLDTIDFNASVFPQATPATIAMTSALPTISDSAGTVISALDKTTTPVTLPAGVILDGATAGVGVAGLTMTTGSNRLLGLVIQNFLGAGVVMGSGTGNEVSAMVITGNTGGGITVVGNSAKLFQNTINNSATGVTVSAGVTGLDLRNNLITNNATAGISSATGTGTIDQNGYFNNGGTGNVHCTGGCTIGANSIKANPRYTSATNFALLASSPAINRGIDLTTNQPDMNGTTALNFNSTLPDLGARESTFSIPVLAGSTLSELIPITVYFSSSLIPFTWDIQPTVSTSQSGVDRVLLTLPTGYSVPDVTSATVSGTTLTVGTTNCATAPNLPDTNEFCFSVSGSVLTVTLGKRVIDTTSPKQITVNFTLTVPSVKDSGLTFTGVVDDAMTTSATVAVSAGNANGVAANAITDNDTLTVKTVDTVMVTNTTDTINGNTGSAALLISAPGTDGISLREALTAVGNGVSFLDTIDFTASLGTITVTGSSLPSLTDLAGTIITGIGSTVQVTQSGLPAGSDGLTITAGSNKIVGMIIRNFPDVGILIAGGTNKIFHNTLYANATGVLVGDGVTGLDLRNNLITSNSTAGIFAASSVGTIDVNGYVSNGGTGNAHCTGGCLIGANSIKADPRYTNVSSSDFSLLASSPAINRGVNLGADQPAFNSTGPDMGARESSFTTPAVASSAVSELTPITVYFGSTGIPFAWDTLPTITATQSGVDQVTLTLPTGYSAPVVSGVTVSGTGLIAGGTNCTTAPNLPDNNEYCASVSGSVVTITSGIRVSNASGNKRITANLTLTVPLSADAGKTFAVAIDDAMTSASMVSATNGNANGTAGNAVTDNDTLTVTTVDKVTVRTTTDTVNGDTTSAQMLVAFPGTDGISLREAMTAVNAGVSVGFLDTIDFNPTVFPSATPATINVTFSTLPSLADSAGTIITALNPLVGVILNGAVGTGAGLTLSSGTNRISRLEIKNFPGNGITISGGTGSIIESSLIRSNGGVGISLTGSNHKLLHLTINGNTGNGITNVDATTQVRNSLITNNSGFGISSPAADIDYSGFFGNVSGNCTGGCTIGAASLPFDPVYTNAGTGDFTLQSTSSMINMGIDLNGAQPDQNGGTTGLYNGNFPDIGRYETATAATNPSVAITKTTSTPIVNGGGAATYTITLTNSGARGARGIAVTDTLPAGFTYTATSATGGSATRTSTTDPLAGTGVPLWANWFIPQGGGTLTITFTAAATAPQGTYDNNVSSTSIDVTITSFTGAPVQVLGYNVSGVVFSDANRNGALDLAETGIVSVTVRIFAMPANSLVATQTTNSTGNYIFTGIANGSYEIRETVPANHAFTTPTTLAITINNAHITGQHFGNFAGTKITGVIFLDTGTGGGTPNNGVREGSESGINAVAVKVTDTGGGTVYDQTVTSQSGVYTLWVPTAITISVVVRETNPANYISTTPDTISLSAVPGVDLPNNHFADVPPLSFSPNGNQTAKPGGVVMFAHTIVAGTAGQITLSTTTTQGLSFTFYKDTNGNGQIDAGEPILTSADLNLTANQTLKFISRTMIPSNKALGSVDTSVITALQALVNSSFTDTRSVMDVTTVSTGTLRLVKNGSVTTAKPGDSIVYTLTYTNIGTDTLTTIILYDRLSEYLLFVSGVPAPDVGFPDSAGVLRWTIPGTLAGGNGGALSYTVTVR